MRILIITIPLISSLNILFFGRYLGSKGGKLISMTSMIISIIISMISLKEYLIGRVYTIEIKYWINIGQLIGKIDFIYDKESLLMINLISVITMIVIIYSFWYLKVDAHINRFISKLLLFAVSMYILVSSKNIFFSFFGWEGVGIVSFLLINFWANSIHNSKSALKAIIFNKIGDIFYLLGIIILALYLYTFDYNNINLLSHDSSSPFFSLISLSFIIAAMAKSAQIFLHSWLGEAMAGPTPVSALLHAATMVTAGIFLIIRTKGILFNSFEILQYFIFIIGSFTILFAGISALNQSDIKKVIAYSTCSQIGYMFFALSLLKPYEGSLYHLITHGFFKALLFLCAGFLIHSFLLEQDLRKYGNLLFNAPLFYLFFLIGTLSIIAFPSFSGFFSKDLILLHSLNFPIYYFIILFLGAIFSSLYSIKIIILSFFNSSTFFNSNLTKFHPLDSFSYFLPFLILIFGSVFLGFFSSSFFASPETINLTLEFSLRSNIFLKVSLILLPVLSLFLFILAPNNLFFSNILTQLYPVGSHKFFFDTLYNYLILKPYYVLSYQILFKFIDRGFLELFGPISLFRLFFFFPKYFNLSLQSSSNTPFLFFYFFLSLFFFFFPFFFFLIL